MCGSVAGRIQTGLAGRETCAITGRHAPDELPPRLSRLSAACHVAKTMLSMRGEGDAVGLAAALIAAVDSLDVVGEPVPNPGGGRWSDGIQAGCQPGAATGEHSALLDLASRYLLHTSIAPHGDPVARFHLSNGASRHGINWAADLSPKGIRQSSGVMVDYLYDVPRLERNHEAFVNGIVMRSGRATAGWPVGRR